MKVFLSWSGNRSKAVAESFGSWLAQVIQAVDPWISSGIQKGTRWQAEIVDRLEEAKVGIVCLTSSNLNAPWILFEAGALSKTKGSYVCTYLLDIAPPDIEPPLGQFQHTVFSKDDTWRLLRTINEVVGTNGERSLTEENLAGVFEVFWPRLESALVAIREQKEEKPIQRGERALLEEVLQILRAQEQRALNDRRTREEFRAREEELFRAVREQTHARASRPTGSNEARALVERDIERLVRIRRAEKEAVGGQEPIDIDPTT